MDWDTLFFLTVIVLSFLFKVVFGTRHRFVWTPVAIAVILAGECGVQRFATNWILYQAIRLAITLAKAYVLCGLSLRPWQRNIPAGFFLLFWTYLMFMVVMGDHPEVSFLYYTKSLEYVLVGYYAGMWAMETPGGGTRLLKWGCVAAGIVALCWIRGGGVLTGAMADSVDGRIGVDESRVSAEAVDMGLFNVNGIGLMTSAVIGYSFLAFFIASERGMLNKLFKIGASGITLLLAIIIIRTGARNSAMAFLPMAWYLLCGKTRLSMGHRLLAVVILCLGMCIMLTYYMGDAETIRAFDFTQEEGDRFGSGRLGWFKDIYEGMGDGRVFGMGAMFDYRDGMIRVANMHSMYMQIFYMSGLVGSFLFGLFVLVLLVRGLFVGVRGHVALVLFGIWLGTGIGEAANINRSGMAKVALGIAMACCTSRKLKSDPFWNNPRWTRLFPDTFTTRRFMNAKRSGLI